MRQSFYVRALWSGLLFLCVSVVTSILIGFLWNGLSTAGSVIALFAGLLVATLTWKHFFVEERPHQISWIDKCMIVLFALVSLRAMLWLIVSAGDEWRVLSPNNVGDLSLHITFIRYLAGGIAFWPESPILLGTPLAYPIGMDLFNALLACVGVPTLNGLIWVGLFGSFLTLVALWQWGRGFTIACLIFNGGIAGWAFFLHGQLEDYQSALAWKNIFLSMFVTQRGLLYALPAGLALLDVWRRRIRRQPPVVPQWVEILIYSTLPIFHVHTFIFLSLLLSGGIFLSSFRRHAIALALFSLVPATLSMFLVTAGFSMSGHIHWKPGWMDGGLTPWFWIQNFGISLPLWIYVAILMMRRKNLSDGDARYFVWGASLLFLLGLCVMLSPWEWDNMKILFWAWITVSPFLWQYGIAPYPKGWRILLCLLLFTSGAISLVAGLDQRHGYPIAKRSELDHTAALIRGIPKSDRFVAAPTYNHPLLLLGRKVVMGYDGHLWSYGLDYTKTLRALEIFFQTGRNDFFFAYPDVQWAFYGNPERRAFADSPFKKESDRIWALSASPSSSTEK